MPKAHSTKDPSICLAMPATRPDRPLSDNKALGAHRQEQSCANQRYRQLVQCAGSWRELAAATWRTHRLLYAGGLTGGLRRAPWFPRLEKPGRWLHGERAIPPAVVFLAASPWLRRASGDASSRAGPTHPTIVATKLRQAVDQRPDVIFAGPSHLATNIIPEVFYCRIFKIPKSAFVQFRLWWAGCPRDGVCPREAFRDGNLLHKVRGHLSRIWIDQSLKHPYLFG